MDANVAIGVGLAVGSAACGVGIGQGIAVNGALNGMARQPELRGFLSTQMLIGLAFPELAFLLSFLIAFLLMGKVSAPTATSMLQRDGSHQINRTASPAFSLRDGAGREIVLSQQVA